MMKNRRDFGGTYAFSSCAIEKKPLQIGVIYRKRKKWQKRGVDDKLLNALSFTVSMLCFRFSSFSFFFFNMFSFVSQHWSFYFLSFIKQYDFFFSFKVFSFFYQTVAFFFFFLTKSRRLFLYLKIAFFFNFFLNFFGSMVVFIF